MEAVKQRRRYTWMTLLDGVQLVSLGEGTLVLAFADEGKRRNFLSSGSDEILRQALIDVLGVDSRVDAIFDPARAGRSDADRPAGRASTGDAPSVGAPRTTPQPTGPAAPEPPSPGPTASPAPATGRATPAPATARPSQTSARIVRPEDDQPADDDPDESGFTGRDLLVRELGASVIEEIDHS